MNSPSADHRASRKAPEAALLSAGERGRAWAEGVVNPYTAQWDLSFSGLSAAG